MKITRVHLAVVVSTLASLAMFARPVHGQASARVLIRPQPVQLGACCHLGGCTVKKAGQCAGTFLGAGTTCNGPDCNGNGWADKCDVGTSLSADGNNNNVPDECEVSCGVPCDAWETVPGSNGGTEGTYHTFNNYPIPAGFFEDNSLAFTGTVELMGVPLDPNRFGNADTLVQRDQDPLSLSAPIWDYGYCTPRIKALRMQSVQSITVDHADGSSSDWDVEVGLSEATQDDGYLTATKEHANGGTYSSYIPVKPRLVFRRVGEPFDFRVLDVGVEWGVGFDLGGFNSPWVHSLLPGFKVFDNYSLYFIPGVDQSSGLTLLTQQFTVEVEEEGKKEVQEHTVIIPDDCDDCTGGPTGTGGIDPGDGKTNFEEGGNPPEFGGGDKICADANAPGGVVHNQVLITALIVPTPQPGVPHTTYFRIMDPDHYSPSMLPSGFDPNGGTTPNDNILVDDSFNIGATLNPSSVTIIGDGVTNTVSTVMTIHGRQPTNNFIVVSHCDLNYVNGVTFAPDGMTLIDASGVPVPDCNRTPLITVWRCLHLELDKMGQTVLTEGPSDEVSLHPSGVVSAGAGTVSITTDINTLQEDQFKGGKITLTNSQGQSLGVFDVVGNNVAFGATIQLATASPVNTTGFTNLMDDDAQTPSNPVAKVNPTIPDAGAANDSAFFRAACVEVKTDTLSNYQDTNLPFHLNLDFFLNLYRQDLRSIISGGKQVTSTDDFWVIYAQGAYQDRIVVSWDPPGAAILGKSTSGVGNLADIATNASEGGVLVYNETIRDAASDPNYFVSEADLRKWTLVHEMGHEFGMEHSDGGIMQPAEDQFTNPNGPQNVRFEPISLDRIMRINHPGFGGQ